MPKKPQAPADGDFYIRILTCNTYKYFLNNVEVKLKIQILNFIYV